ncbi:tRNA dihydrouridine synthase [Legionella shakespearei]|uniref:tRNA-dihydrouridine synthase n=1 Tax=Legionella shakespearei DSM 23087 TaxID=1122169 RepID=A0A0W0YLD6_9GAMM|nr:tRNA-dihydrouridine synthase family protein [Legionella shakespearei]KTD57503.1 tRNA-dihydrouridine synthase B [Legionella shakespearei DSM 23087]
MHTIINSPFTIGDLKLPHRLIQGPLAGYSCAPFRELFYRFRAPAYCVSEMSSAMDIVHKHSDESRYIYRSPQEQILAYQISGTDPQIMAQAALQLQNKGADLIDINCGCPKTKIRKKGAGSALLEQPEQLSCIIKAVRAAITIPLTVKIRIQGNAHDVALAQLIEASGADALIVHGRRWVDDYDIQCDFHQIATIKKAITIPVIANGDIRSVDSLQQAMSISSCDGFMIGRAGSGRPWLYQELLEQRKMEISASDKRTLFISHLEGLASLEDEYKAVLQSKSLIRYYFRGEFSEEQFNSFYRLNSLGDIRDFLVCEYKGL